MSKKTARPGGDDERWTESVVGFRRILTEDSRRSLTAVGRGRGSCPHADAALVVASHQSVASSLPRGLGTFRARIATSRENAGPAPRFRHRPVARQRTEAAQQQFSRPQIWTTVRRLAQH